MTEQDAIPLPPKFNRLSPLLYNPELLLVPQVFLGVPSEMPHKLMNGVSPAYQ